MLLKDDTIIYIFLDTTIYKNCTNTIVPSMIKKILFYIFFIIIIVISGLIWPYISLPYENTSIISEYSKNNYNQNNDLIRYLVFILIPILSLILLLIISKNFQ